MKLHVELYVHKVQSIKIQQKVEINLSGISKSSPNVKKLNFIKKYVLYLRIYHDALFSGHIV